MSGWERYLIDLILRRPGFHRAVEKIHTQVHRIQHGQPPQYARGGTHVDDVESGRRKLGDLIKLFWQELRKGHRGDAGAGGKGGGGGKG